MNNTEDRMLMPGVGPGVRVYEDKDGNWGIYLAERTRRFHAVISNTEVAELWRITYIPGSRHHGQPPRIVLPGRLRSEDCHADAADYMAFVRKVLAREGK